MASGGGRVRLLEYRVVVYSSLKKKNTGSIRGGDRVLVDGQPAVVAQVTWKAGKGRRQRIFAVRFEDGSVKHVSASRIDPR